MPLTREQLQALMAMRREEGLTLPEEREELYPSQGPMGLIPRLEYAVTGELPEPKLAPTVNLPFVGPLPEEEGPQLPEAWPERWRELTEPSRAGAEPVIPEHIQRFLREQGAVEQIQRHPDLGEEPQPMAEEVPPMSAQSRAKALETLAPETPIPAPTGPEPFEREAARESRIDRLEAEKALSTGLSQIGQSLAQWGTGQELDMPAPAAPGTEAELAEARDVMPYEERQFLQDTFGLAIPEGLSRSRIEQILPQIGAMTRARSSQEAKEAMDRARMAGTQGRHEERMGLRRAEMLPKIAESFVRNPRVKAHRDAIDNVNKSIESLDLDVQQGDQAAAIGIARAAGEKGVLTDRDVARWLSRHGVIEKSKAWISMAARGRLTAQHRAELRMLADGFKKVSQEAIDREAQMMSRVWSRRPALQIDEGELYSFLSEAGGGAKSLQPAGVGGMPGTGTTVKLRQKSTGKMWEVSTADWAAADATEKADFEVVE